MVRNSNYKDLVPALHLATTFRQSHDDDNEVSEPNFTYSRTDNANLHHLERELSVILGGRGDSITYSSGMAAIVTLLLHLKPRRIFMVPGYFGTTGAIRMLSELSPINLVTIDSNDILWLETPLNPTGEILGIEAYCNEELAADDNLIDIVKYMKLAYDLTTGSSNNNRMTVVCDATLSPPPLFTPLEFGVDYAIYSATKALGGRSDLLSGVIATNNKPAIQKLRDQRGLLGSVMRNLKAWLLIRSLKTLTLRLNRQSRTCYELVNWLISQPPELPPNIIDRIYHSSNQQDLTPTARLPYHGHAPVLAIMFTSRHYAQLAPSLLTTSLGGYHSFIEWRHRYDPDLHPHLCRISIGLEPLSILQVDLVTMAHRLATTAGPKL